MSLTFLQLKTRVALALQDVGNVYWTAGSATAELDTYINDGLRVFSQQTECLRNIFSLDVGSSSDHPLAWWTAPFGVSPISWFDVWYNGQSLARVTSRDEGRNFANWEDQTGTPARYISGVGGNNSIRLCPMPATAAVQPRAEMSYLAPTLGVAGDIPAIPEEYHQYLEDYAVARALSRDGEKQDLDEAARRMQIFMGAVADCKAAASKDYSHAERNVYADYF